MESAQTTFEGEEEPVVLSPVSSSHRRLPMALVTLAFVLLILVIVVVLLVVKVTRGSTTVSPPPVAPAPGAVVQAATSVPARDFDLVGAPVSDGPAPLVVSGKPLVVDGRPGVVFVGAEFCPYCAAERWALVVALGRFGTFSKLGATSSSKFEAFPGTATFSFEGATYRSPYVSFTATEQYGPNPSEDVPAGFPKLQSLPPLQQTLLKRYESELGLAGDSDTLPFVDVGGRLVIGGSAIGFSPGLMDGDSMSQIAGDLSNPTNPVAVAILGEANEITAAVCSATGQAPAKVCDSSGVQAAAARLGLGT